jgi:hypothetical protein
MPENAVSTNASNAGEVNEKPSWTINDEAPEESESNIGGALGSTNASKEASMDKAIDKGLAAAKGKEKTEAKKPAFEKEEGAEKPPVHKHKLKVGDEELELDEESMKRWAQKGIHYEKKNYNTAKAEKEVKAKAEALAAKEAEVAEVYEALQSESAFEILEKKHGKAKARELAEKYLRPQVMEELELAEMTPDQKRAYIAEQKAAELQKKIDDGEKAKEQEHLSAEEQKWTKHYQDTIIKALDSGGVPKTDFSVAEMAAWIRRGKAQKVDYTPEQLANLVKQDNIVRVDALTENYVNQINEAKKSGDQDSIVKAGEALVELLGEPVMYALAKYHLAKTNSVHKSLPTQTVDTPKVDVSAPKKKLTWDEERDLFRKRAAALARGENPPSL